MIFTGQIHDRELLRRIYTASDLMTFPSLYDNASIVIIEAASIALPALLIEGAVCTEGTQNGFNASLAHEDKYEYASEMKRILSDDKTRMQVGRNAQNTIFRSKEEAAIDVRTRYLEIIEEYKKKH